MTGLNVDEAGESGARRTDTVAVRPNPLRIDVFRNSGNAFEGGVEWRSEPFDYSGYLFRFGDTEAHGRTDLIAIQPNPLRMVTWRNNGGSFGEGREWHIEPYDYGGYLFFDGDIDGDGRADIVAVQRNPLRMVTWRSNGSAFEGGREWLTEPYDYSDYTFFAGDIDGDGRTDVVAVQDNPWRVVTWRNNGNGDGFEGGREWLTEPYDYSGYTLSIGDIDGDGRTDVIAIRQNPLRIVTWRNNGNGDGFEGGREWLTEPGDYSGYLVSIGDIDGDGKADIIAVHRDPLRMITWRNNGGGFDTGREWFPPADVEVSPDLTGLFGLPAPGPITILTMTAT